MGKESFLGYYERKFIYICSNMFCIYDGYFWEGIKLDIDCLG